MKRVKEFSIVSIVLLVFQLFSGTFGLLVAAAPVDQASVDDGKVSIEALEQEADTITWAVTINEENLETDGVETYVTFDKGQTHGTIDELDEADVQEEKNGYHLTTSSGTDTYEFKVTTTISKNEQENFELKAEADFNGQLFKAEEQIENTNKRTEEQEQKTTEEIDKISESKEESTEGEDPETNTATDETSKREDVVSDESDESDKSENSTEDIEEEIGTKSQSIFSKTAKPNAIPGVMSGEQWPEPGSLKLDKQATETDNFAEWEIELNVEGKNLKTSSDIVIVFDRSNSMYGSRATKAKAAAKEFVNSLLVDEHSTARIALVPFGSDTGTQYDPHTDFQDFSGKQKLLNAIDAIQIYRSHQSGGTNIHAGLHAADEFLDNSTADQKTIVLMSDGAPTYSHRANSAAAHSWPNNKYNFILSDFNYSIKVGSGSDYNLPAGGWFNPDHRYNVDGYRVTTNGIATISEAQNIINSGKDIYAIGLEVGNVPNAIYTLENSHNKGYYQGGEDDMSPIFEEIAASLAYPATNSVVTDPLGEMFDLVKDGSYNGENFEASHGTVNWNDESETFEWDIGSVKEDEVYTLKYKVELDCTKDPKVGEKYPTNKTTTMDYKDHNGSNASKNFPIPKVDINAVKITKLGYRVNVDGEPIDSNGNVVTPEEAVIFYDELYGEGLKPDYTYFVPAGDTPDEYQLHDNFDDPAKVKVTNQVCNVAMFGYVHESELPAGDVVVKHVDEDGNELVPSETLTGKIGDSYSTEKKNIDNYEFVKMHEDSADAIGTFTSEEQTVIYVYKPKKGTIKLVKIDEHDSNKYLQGAKFKIKDSNDNTVDDLVTDSNGVAFSELLDVGEYTLVETEAPYGYKLSENQDLKINVEADKVVKITVTNKALKGSVTITKIDADDNSKLLEGAEFKLVDENDNAVTGRTDNQGEVKFTDLTIGTYTLTETKAPEGYRLLQQPIEIEITPEDLNVKKTIENTEQGWELPKTGGIGTIGFYGIGLILMGIALWFVLRRKHI